MKNEELTWRRGDAYAESISNSLDCGEEAFAVSTSHGLEEVESCLTAGEQSEPAETARTTAQPSTRLRSSASRLRGLRSSQWLFLFFALLLCSCADDLEAPASSADGETSVVTLSVPYTRTIPTTDPGPDGDHSQADADELERKVTSLWFLAYPTDGKGEAVVQTLDPTPEDLKHDEARTFSIRMKHGQYKVYVVANVSGITPQTSEDALKATMLKAQTDAQGLYQPIDLQAPNFGGLPMLYEGTFNVSQEGQTLTADLVFCCVKVRYTLTFDNTEGTDAHAIFGQNYLHIDEVTARQVAPKQPLVPRSPHYIPEDTEDTEDNKLLTSSALPGGYVGEDASTTTDQPTRNGQWSYTGVVYLPEHYIDADTQSQQTLLRIAASIYSPDGVKKSNVEYTIDLGHTDTEVNEDPDNLRQLPRGHYYDITARIQGLGSELKATAVVNPWTLQSVTTEAEGPYWLWVEKTSVPLTAGQEQTILLRTDAPHIELGQEAVEDFENPNPYAYTLTKIDGGDSGVDTLCVSVNPEFASFRLAHPNVDPKLYFWIDLYDKDNPGASADGCAPVLRKYIQIDPLTIEPYFRVSPPQYTIYIKDVANQPEYAVTFTYETNLEQVRVNHDCANTHISITSGTDILANGTTLTKQTGTITVTLNEPYVPANFPKNETITFDYEASGYSLEPITAQTRVTIVPNATKYRLHFRPIDDLWTNPHIYVYEILRAPDGREVKMQWVNGGEDDSSTHDDYIEQENALLYGFTGGVTYKGWQNQGGTVPWDENSSQPNSGLSLSLSGDIWLPNDNGNNRGDGSWNPLNTNDGAYQLGNSNIYDYSIDYCPEFREDCCATFDASNSANHHNIKWPGVKMKPDLDNPGWYYFDLPALASPGSTLIMFADGHSGPSFDLSEAEQAKFRYPPHLDPGVPLYDYEDKDGWFLYDQVKGRANEFVDDKPTDIADKPALPMGTYRIWCTSNSNFASVHIWGAGDYASWGTTEENMQTDPGTGRKYFDLVVDENWRPVGNDLTVYYIFYGGGQNQTATLDIAQSDWQTVTGQDYDYEVYK